MSTRRCKGITAGGGRCRKKPKGGGDYCADHGAAEPVSRAVKFDDKKKDDFIKALGAGMGKTEAAAVVGVCRQTVYGHMRDNPEFRERVQRATDTADGVVENALFNAARSGNVGAICFWLKNRRPDEWKDMKTYEVVREMEARLRPRLFKAMEQAGVTQQQIGAIADALDAKAG